MVLTAEQIKSNYDVLLNGIEKYVTGERKQQFLDFYNKLDERIALLPASHKKAYHNCFPGGYVDHVIRVITAAFKVHKVWQEMGTKDTYTEEELFVAALNHDLGKIGSLEHVSVVPSTDEWRKKNLGEMYQYNKKLAYMSVPDRSIKLLVDHDIKLTENEWMTIKLHDGLYDQANEPYLKNYMPEQKPRTSMVFIIHQADLMAARIEFEQVWLSKFNEEVLDKPKAKKLDAKTKTLGSMKSEGLKNMLNSL